MKRMVRLGFAALASMLVCSACGITYRNKEVNRFIGQNESVLYAEYGQPWRVEKDSQGRNVLTFELRHTEYIQTEGTSWTDSSGVVHTSPATTREEQHVEHRIFVIDQDGRIIQAKWRLY